MRRKIIFSNPVSEQMKYERASSIHITRTDGSLGVFDRSFKSDDSYYDEVEDFDVACLN
jgi:hypothetical protein